MSVEVAAPRARAPAPARWRLSGGTLGLTALLAIVAVLVLFPIIQMVIQSFRTAMPGQTGAWSLDGWRAVLGERALQTALWNTIALTVVRQLLALVIAVFIAWLLARTDLPGGRVFEFVFWLAFFLPSLTVTLSWILILDPKFGILNQALAATGLTNLGIGPLNIYSFWGIVWVHLVGSSIALKVMILTPIFRNMNSAYEEASLVAGASTLGTMARVFVPLMLPAILAVQILSVVRSLEAFEVEQILGTPAGIYVFSTWMYDQLYQTNPRYAAISATGTFMLLAALGLIVLQRVYLHRRQFTTVTGQFQGQVTRLGKQTRWIAFGFVGVIALIIIGVPVIFSVMGTFMKLFGFFIDEPWTLKHWAAAFSDRLLVRGIQNTAVLATGTAIISLLVMPMIAYVIIRTRFQGRGALDFLTWLPITVPGILLSFGMLTMLLLPPFRPIYGSMASLILVLVVAGMPLAVQVLKSNLLQMSKELEEASWLSGANWWRTYRRILLPLISPSLVVITIIAFIAAARNVAQVALLSNASIRPLSIMQLEYIAQGKYEVASVMATMLLFVSLGLALVIRAFGYRSVGER
jgi:iron(III) transport system permease protein